MKKSNLKNLKKHIKWKHKGVRYPCDVCDDSSASSAGLKIHIKSKHEAVRCHCIKGEYLATTTGNLKIHIKVRYSCDKCDYVVNTLDRLVKSEHGKKSLRWPWIYSNCFRKSEGTHKNLA